MTASSTSMPASPASRVRQQTKPSGRCRESEAPPLVRLLPRVAPRPVLLIAAGGRPHEIPVNRVYRRAVGPSAVLWPVPEAGHTGAIRARPLEYEQRTIGFLRRALHVR